MITAKLMNMRSKKWLHKSYENFYDLAHFDGVVIFFSWRKELVVVVALDSLIKTQSKPKKKSEEELILILKRLVIVEGGIVESWVVHSSWNRLVWVQALPGDIVLCSWARHLTPTVPLSTQVYKWLPGNLMLGVTLRWTSIPFQRGAEILLVASCYGNRDKLRPDRPLGSCADLTCTFSKSWASVSLSHGWRFLTRF